VGVGHCKTAQIQDQLPLNQTPSRGRDLVRGADLACDISCRMAKTAWLDTEYSCVNARFNQIYAFQHRSSTSVFLNHADPLFSTLSVGMMLLN